MITQTDRFERELRWVLEQLDQQEYSPKTLRDYRLILQRLNRQIDGGLLQAPDALRPKFEAWRDDLQVRVRLPDANHLHVSRSKITCDVSALRTFYTTLVERNRYPENPTLHIRGGGNRKGSPRPMPHSEFSKLCLNIDQTTPDGLRDRTMIELCYHGLRNREVCRLRIGSVRYAAADKSFWLHVEGKGDKDRSVAIANESSAALFARYVMMTFSPDKPLSHWAAPEHEAEVYESLVIRAAAAVLDYMTNAELRGGEPLFRTDSGVQPDNHWLGKRFKRYRQLAQLGPDAKGKPWGPHSLRHSCATDLLTAGKELLVVKKILGHKDTRSTEVYADIVPDLQVSAMRSLNTPAAHVPEPELVEV